MRIPGLKSLLKGGRWLRSRFVNNALILGYHRITEDAFDPYQICVSPSSFAEQLQILREHANPISLVELTQALTNGRIPPRAVALTIDDGYDDIYREAFPLLQQFQVPATIFVTTGGIERVYWWDRLVHLLFSPTVLPSSIQLEIGNNVYTRQQTGSDLVGWRQNLLRCLYPRLLELSESQREESLLAICAWSGAEWDTSSLPAGMSARELAEVASHDLIEIGAHTVSHPILASLSQMEQRAEIYQSKATLESILGWPIMGFSYPNGSSANLTRMLVKDAGFEYACTSYNDIVWRGSDIHHLPRFWVQDWNGASFHNWLERWLHR